MKNSIFIEKISKYLPISFQMQIWILLFPPPNIFENYFQFGTNFDMRDFSKEKEKNQKKKKI